MSNTSGMTIRVEAKNRYGTWFYYPVCERAKIFQEIVGSKTLTTEVLTLIKKLGYEVDVETEVPTIPNH